MDNDLLFRTVLIILVIAPITLMAIVLFAI
jgi:hypothetical protein